jgi:hypothetical protein
MTMPSTLKSSSKAGSNDCSAALIQSTNQLSDDHDAGVVMQPDEAIGEVLEWLANVVINEAPISVRALAACAYDALGGLVSVSWPPAQAEANALEARELADGGVDLPAIKSVVIMPTDRP